ncbi:2-hydroxyhepta-2,4-diene-1,7-dioate isomerase, conjectural [Pyrobaculum aerophilum str. IM2]|uniref:2-hydroxyhepta-2,4-diene-1,7-dioate isomerase, conjectural n=2 Tax=Pyrobaculum aerophilum TaxID=13773 RepID=Q8ZUN9_PYRAE|nr:MULTISPECIES: fumarylacetoacetate hydrolase family protein [Pyrobaculum]AAL64367.1 2-hydroxyhepta-2,4-diene-1,7-dioate isomerase, conjectural [Pyrobaculum aerophilum str. IM2]HII46770.1 fumarylacetoacetate hydrolase family protein [Pyrobaculum aerophilum]
MKLLTFRKGEVRRVGVLQGDVIIDLPKAYLAVYDAFEAPDFLYDMKKLIAVGRPALEIVDYLARKAPEEAKLSPKEIVWEPPVTNPEKIFAVAVNYKAHGQEAGVKPPERPYFFPKFPNALVGHEQPVIKHKVTQKVDWEVELVVVIGRAGKYIDPARALDYVFGYTVGNDISIRDWQFPPGWPQQLNPYGQNWIWGKSMDTAAPVGPYIVTKDEIEDPNRLGLRLRVNGQLEQEGNTSELIFNVQQLIHWASQGITLKPGDLIFTGTPPGVGFPKGKFLKHGDVVEAEVEKIGVLRNYVVEEGMK